MALNIIPSFIPSCDISAALQEQVQSSIDLHSPLLILGGGSKSFYGRPPVETSNILDLKDHIGVIDYDPTELAITVRAGTRLQDLELLLAKQQQILPFEPPLFDKNSTIGGVVSSGISGPRRAFSGSIRDAVLGVEIINGEGKIVHFGGQVMKNVAGYDMSRLMVRSMGTLGVILSVSLRVLPKPAKEITLVVMADQEESLAYCKRWRREHLPISATTWYRGTVYVRLSGTETTLEAAQQKLSKEISFEQLEDDETFWQSIRNQQHAFFKEINKPLWRLSLPINAPVIARFSGDLLTEWGGTQRWVSNNAPANIVRAVVEKHGGYATLFGGQKYLPEVPPFPVLAPELLELHKRLKRKLDPHNIFNPGRLYRDL
ncbi:MAG: glycolate oxidase subunit GlcE [Cocleimonas sp.]|nr:glycolate oxidase subunit GlcE [Cocleimonas sp.]